jgi:hypothetical protein
MANEDTVADRAFREGVPHVRTAVVAGVVAAFVQEDSQVGAVYGEGFADTLHHLSGGTELVVGVAVWLDLGARR